MSFFWNEYLDLAEHLAGKPDQPSLESKQRTSISRAYYACFNIAKFHMTRIDKADEPVGEKAHEEVRKHFQLGNDNTRSKIAEELANLRWDRNDADYKLNVDISNKVGKSLWRARNIIKWIEGLGPLTLSRK